MKGISQREFAKRDGCARRLVQRGLEQGKLISYDDGTIDPALVGTPWRRGNFHKKAGEVAPPPADGLDSFAEAQRRKENYLARLRQLEFEIKSGKLVDGETVQRRVFALAREDRDALLTWPAQVAPVIAAEIGADQVKLAVALDNHIHTFLVERARLRRGG